MINVFLALFILLGLFLLVNAAVFFVLNLETKQKGTKDILYFWLASFILYLLDLTLPEKSLGLIICLALKSFPVLFLFPLLIKRPYTWVRTRPLFLSLISAAFLSFALEFFKAPGLFINMPLLFASLIPLFYLFRQELLNKKKKKASVLSLVFLAAMAIMLLFGFWREGQYQVAQDAAWVFAQGLSYMLASILLTVKFLQRKAQDEQSYLKSRILAQERELRESTLEKDRILRVLVHDVSNPLQAAMFQLGQLKKIAAQNEREIELTRKVEKSIYSIKSIIAHVREYQHVISPAKTEKHGLEEIRLTECLQEIKDLFCDRFQEKKVQLLIHNKLSEETTIMVNKTAFIHSVAANLLSNALKFSMPGSEVLILASEKDGHILLEIADRGIGMSKENLRQLFDVGSQVARSGTLGERGMGFGMPVVKAYMGLFNGRIEAESHQDEFMSGTTISLFLPKTDQFYRMSSPFLP